MANYKEGKFGVGIRGTGQVARQHAEAIQANPHVYIAAVCGRDPEHARAFARSAAPQARIYNAYADMLADPDVDVIVECMPNYLHAEESLLALQAKKHLVLEKPVGITQEETDALFAAASANQELKTVVSFLIRWVPLVENLKGLIRSGAIGDVYYTGTDYWHGIKPSFSSYPWIRKKSSPGAL